MASIVYNDCFVIMTLHLGPEGMAELEDWYWVKAYRQVGGREDRDTWPMPSGLPRSLS